MLGYKLHDLQETASGLNAVLELKTDCKIYSPDVKLLKFELWYETDTRIHFKISDLAGTSYEIPEELFVRPKSSSGTSKETATYEFVLLEDPVAFKVIRKADGEVLFDSSQAGGGSFMSPLIFGRQYLEISTRVPVDANIYGLGEAVHAFRRDPFGTRQTMWSRDAPTPKDQNVYGVHPFYLEMRKGKAHGVFLLNSNGMDVLIRRGSVTWKVLGGALEFYVFVGPTPADVVHQYYEVIGHPHMISYWSLGFQHCRYGYNNVWEVKEVVRRYREAKIPLETMWTDIDYMDNMKDFTLDPKNFPLNEMKSLVKDLQSRTQKYILILDPAIKVEQNYGPYEDGVKEGIFIKQANGNVFTGKVWPGVTAFPDFTNPKTQNYWTKWISIFMKDLPVDGWWIDMNEPASFCNGQCGNFDAETETDEGTQKKFTIDQSADNDEFNPNSPGYKINNAGWEAPLDTATVSADALHHNNTLHYNVHNLYGHSEAIMTRNSILKINPGKRPFVLSRSTFPSSGVYAGHWTGDNWSNWEHLYLSIPAILNFQLFGIPYVGADICGFVGDTTEELCGRWMQLGAFYPFSRNHNGKGHRSQEPYLWPRVAEASRNALKVRYEMLPYFYTLFYQSHNFGATVLRPLFFEFPDDTDTYMLDRQFLIGSSVLITPCLTQGAVSVNGYFPNGVWYDWYTHRALTENNRGSKGNLQRI
jgi:alpha-glucosidase (family GH31 glycosyl hydrolase)